MTTAFKTDRAAIENVLTAAGWSVVPSGETSGVVPYAVVRSAGLVDDEHVQQTMFTVTLVEEPKYDLGAMAEVAVDALRRSGYQVTSLAIDNPEPVGATWVDTPVTATLEVLGRSLVNG